MINVIVRAAVLGVLVTSIGALSSAQQAQKPSSKTASILGTWQASDGGEVVHLIFHTASELELEGERFPYVQTAKVIRIDEDGEMVEYPYVLKGDMLTLTFEGGERLTFHRAGGRGLAGAPTAPAVPAAKGPAEDHLLIGKFMSYSSASSSTGSSSWTTYATFDGQGGFSWSSESEHSASQYDQTGTQTGSGLAYGSNSGNRGSYRVAGDRILVRFPDGSEGEALVKERFGDGSIGAFTYDGKSYAR
ncbi:MAG: hypothetical protein MUE68_12115 [Bacteroidetes bacterium]|nr:hypothetical protein [Bacteroidota bacterium]